MDLEVLEDPIHVVVRGALKTAQSDVIQIKKSTSARKVFRIYAEIKRCYF
jgi:putative transposase